MKILSVAPSRISLFGGGTDVEPYSKLYGGLVINMAINLHSRFSLFTGGDLYHPDAQNSIPYLGNKNFIHTFLTEFKLGDMHRSRFISEFDGVLESGMGSSAATAVGIIGAINKLQNLNMSLSSIAEKAWEIEVKKLNLFGGKQDQYAASFGGVNVMEFKDKVTVTPLARGFIEPLLPSLCLFYTGENRKSAVIQEGFKKLSQYQIDNLNNIKNLALSSIDYIAKGDVQMVGEMMDQVWEYKKHSNKGVSNTRIDDIYTVAKKHGVLGGKVLGAGGGGFMLFVCPITKQLILKEALQKLGCTWWDFSICWSGLDVRILPEE